MRPELETIVEAVIFASPEGASTREITRCVRAAVATARESAGEEAPEEITRFADVTEAQVQDAIAALNRHYEETGRAFLLVERPAGWRIMSRSGFTPWVRELFPDRKPARLTRSALETLAIIAYRQPITRAGIEAVRGVSVDGPLQVLLDRNVIRIAGRSDLPGRPLLYETTDRFLEHFGIRHIDELPNAAELRAVKLPEPPPPTEESANGTESAAPAAPENSPPDPNAPAESPAAANPGADEPAASAAPPGDPPQDAGPQQPPEESSGAAPDAAQPPADDPPADAPPGEEPSQGTV